MPTILLLELAGLALSKTARVIRIVRSRSASTCGPHASAMFFISSSALRRDVDLRST